MLLHINDLLLRRILVAFFSSNNLFVLGFETMKGFSSWDSIAPFKDPQTRLDFTSESTEGHNWSDWFEATVTDWSLDTFKNS